MRILTILTGRRISAVMAAVIALTACEERTASRPAVPQEVGEKSRQFTITDSTSSSGGHRKPGECARALTDRESGTRLVLRGWDERSIRSRRGGRFRYQCMVRSVHERGFSRAGESIRYSSRPLRAQHREIRDVRHIHSYSYFRGIARLCAATGTEA
jgi:hypothetical protein